jgi:hypothetical protein
MVYADGPDKTAREKGNEALSAWRKRNRAKANEQKRRYAERHPEKVRAWNRENYLRHHEARKAQQRAYRAAHPEETRAKTREWYKNNRERATAYKQRYWRNQRGKVLLQRIKKEPIECDLTAEWVQARIDAGICEMSGLPFDMDTKRGPNTPSIDRIDPAGPYTMENCRVILWFLNRAMSNLGEGYALAVFGAVLARRKMQQPNAQTRRPAT